ncbi:4-hydroxyphenylacetate 3-hydroxylase C-terminal domain-containing protein [Paenibacillus kobensis]|uniref:4-hydroxyphenylacetate 3-hydroxylase C-terminal domain-containing protein n=1 Tax=Paenibacillus kobensis TaxID=59841 RepID=UPI000FDB9342|nr:4-hydroxyphenylacetate 3-hydroxylase C-terminal domain-containing protein [Paenibacillus kobensis]
MAMNQELAARQLYGDDDRELPDEQLLGQAYLLPRSPEELRLKRSGFYGLAEGTTAFADGWSDYAHALLAGWYAHEQYVLAEERAASENGTAAAGAFGASRTWRPLYEQIERQLAVVTTSLHPVARHSDGQPVISPDSQGGIRLSGRQTFGADALLVDELLVFVREEGEADPATAALIPVRTEGLKLLEIGSSVAAVYEDVRIPQEKLLVVQDAGRLKRLLGHPLVQSLADYQWASRQLDAIELIAGTSFALAEQTGLGGELHIQGELGELIQGMETLKALLHAAEIGARPSTAGVLLPSLAPLQAARRAGIDTYGKAVHVLQRIGAAAFLRKTNISGASVEGSGKPSLLELAWRLAGSSDASRKKLHEQHAFGDPLVQSQELYRHYPVQLLRSRYREFWQAVHSIDGDGDNDQEVRP